MSKYSMCSRLRCIAAFIGEFKKPSPHSTYGSCVLPLQILVGSVLLPQLILQVLKDLVRVLCICNIHETKFGSGFVFLCLCSPHRFPEAVRTFVFLSWNFWALYWFHVPCHGFPKPWKLTFSSDCSEPILLVIPCGLSWECKDRLSVLFCNGFLELSSILSVLPLTGNSGSAFCF